MALIRGFGGKCPCPICLVPDTKLSDLSKKFELRTTETMQTLYEDAKGKRTISEGEEMFKEAGLRAIYVRLDSQPRWACKAAIH